MLKLKRKKEERGVQYLPMHYMKVILPNGKVVRAVEVSEEGGKLRIVDISGKVIILGR